MFFFSPIFFSGVVVFFVFFKAKSILEELFSTLYETSKLYLPKVLSRLHLVLTRK